MKIIASFALLCAISLAAQDPETTIDYGTFRGTQRYQGVNSFLGMPFAKAGRLENPRILGAGDALNGVQDATQYGEACPQQELTASPYNSNNAQIGAILNSLEQLFFPPISNQGEDCLNINVQVPAGLNSTQGLPVMMWIYGGGFEIGSTASVGAETTAIQGVIYQGANIVQRSKEMGQPIVFVSANYRLNAFGTLASQEITDAGVSNLVLKDQRAAMQWVQKYISKFGGDPDKVTLFGESAGSLSIASHLVLNDGNPEGLFRGAIMASGGIQKLKDYHSTQGIFDLVATRTGCGTAPDKLQCIRTVDYDVLYSAVQQFPNLFSYDSVVPWFPRPDGTYLKDSPHRLLRSGKVADVPYIIGDMKDEGTGFSLIPQLNITNDAAFRDYFKSIYFPSLSDEQVAAFTSKYSEDPRDGSPFDTGYANQLGPQYKRMSAVIGDYVFQSGRRDLLQYTYDKQKAYTYLIEQSLPLLGQVPGLESLTGLPLLGSFHASDVVLNDFGFVPASISKNTRNIMSTFIAFTTSLDPNTHGLSDLPQWPTWEPTAKAMFQYSEQGASIIKDDFREGQMSFMNDNADTYVF